MERDEHDLLTKAELCKLLGVDERTIERMVTDRLLPRSVKYGRQPRWRWGVLKQWMEATEFFQATGLELPPEDDAGESGTRQRASKDVDSATTGDTEAPGGSGTKKQR